MADRSQFLNAALRIGRIGSLRCEVSLWVLFAATAYLLKHGWQYGGAVVLSLGLAAIVSEFSAWGLLRHFGYSKEKMLFWPLGGLAAPAGGRKSDALWLGPLGGLAGLAMGVVICSPVLVNEGAYRCLIPGEALPREVLAWSGWRSTAACLLWAHWQLCIWNLLPIPPLGMGRLLESWLRRKLSPEVSPGMAAGIGRLVAIVVLGWGLLGESVWVVAAGLYLIAWNLPKSGAPPVSPPEEDLCVGYDFSAGYTSLERSASDSKAEPSADLAESPAPPGFLERWLSRRRLLHARHRQARRKLEAQQLDALLAKVYECGLSGLSDRERRQLRRVSRRYKQQTQPGTGPSAEREPN